MIELKYSTGHYLETQLNNWNLKPRLISIYWSFFESSSNWSWAELTRATNDSISNTSQVELIFAQICSFISSNLDYCSKFVQLSHWTESSFYSSRASGFSSPLATLSQEWHLYLCPNRLMFHHLKNFHQIPRVAINILRVN